MGGQGSEPEAQNPEAVQDAERNWYGEITRTGRSWTTSSRPSCSHEHDRIETSSPVTRRSATRQRQGAFADDGPHDPEAPPRARLL
jgi:hypothetical protein